MIQKKKKLIIFTNHSKTKMYFTDEENFDSEIFDSLKCTELENFIDMEDAKEYLENHYGCDVKIMY